MKKFKLFKSGFCEKLKLLLIPIGLLIGSLTSQVWAYNCNYANVYYDNSVTQWTYVQLLYENSGGSNGWNMSHVAHTDLYWKAPGAWSDNNFSGVRFADGTNADWNGSSQNSWNRTGNAKVECTDFFGGDIANNVHLFTCNIKTYDSEKVNIGHPYYGSNPTILNKTVNVGSKTKVGNNDFSASVASVAAISMKHYSFNSSTYASVQDYYSSNVPTHPKGSTSTYAIYPTYTSNVTYSFSNLTSGYEFVGWYDGEDNFLSKNEEYTVYTTSNYDIYAYFAQTHTVTINAGVNGTVTVTGGAPGNHTIGQRGVEITASNTVDDYYFVGWVCTGGASVEDASAATTTVRATADGTVKARFVSKWAVRGTMSNDDWDTYYDLTNKGSNTWSGKIRLSANSVYTFKVYDNPSGATWGYGTTDSYRRSYVGQTTAWGLASGEKELIIMTANEGDYTFSWNSSSKQLTVLYPEITHPNRDYYVYFKNKPAGWSTVTAHLWGDGSVPSTGWDALPVLSTFSFDGDNYYYMALGSHTTGLVSDGSDGSNDKKSADLSLSSHKGQWYDIATKTSQSSEDAARWHDFTATLTFDHEIASNTPVPDNVTVTYGANTNLEGTVITTLPSNSNYPTFGGYYTEEGGEGLQLITAAGAVNANVDGYTSSGNWIRTGESVSCTVYAKFSQNVTLNANHDGYTSNGSAIATYNGGVSSIEAPELVGAEVVGYYADAACADKDLVMDPDGTLHNYTGYVTEGKWTRNAATTLYAKWRSAHFIIYRPGDKDEDNRSIDDQVESFAGGTIDKTIEYRMKVRDIDTWYALSIPFTVNEVKVWDDAGWHDIFPYYRPDVGGTYYQGYYVLRTPRTATELPISAFSDWRDPTDYTYKPEKSKPYIILWHNGYFKDKYVSFFGEGGDDIPEEMTVGDAPKDDGVLNIYGNDAMTSGSVQDGYTYVGDYGGGAWLRNETKGTYRTVPAFECYIRANAETTGKTLVIKRRTDDVTTGWDDVLNSEYKEVITVYTISGLRVAQYTDCSIAEAGRRMNAELSEGIYILSAGNESVKIMIGGK